MPQSVLIIGGGVIGAMAAYYLAREGHALTVLDKGDFGAACSGGNCGLIVPSHLLPLPTPTAIFETLPLMLRRNSAFAIKFPPDLALVGFLSRFALNCTHGKMMHAAHARQKILNLSRRLYDDLTTHDGIECEFESSGCLFVHQSKHHFEAFAKTDALLRKELGVGFDRYEGDTLRTFEPTLKDGLGGAWHYTADAHLRPDKLLASLRSTLIGAGVNIVTHADVATLDRAGDRVTSVTTSSGKRYSADTFVLATGAWSGKQSDWVGAKIPVQPGKGYSTTTQRPAVCPRVPMIFEQHRVVMTPMQSGYRLGSIMEFAGYDDSLRAKRLALLSEAAEIYLREPARGPINETWYGWRPMTPDDLPIIGVAPSAKNLIVATGHNMVGMSMAPATGLVVAQLIGGQTAALDLNPFRVDRFN